jgi:hypothetical protein
MTSEKAEGPAADRTPRTATTTNQATSRINEEADSVDDLGFFRKALSGKVRPAPREPDRTHYGCSCCRWTA